MRVLVLKGLSAWALGGDRTETVRLVSGLAAQGCAVALGADTLPAELTGTPHFTIDYPESSRVTSQVQAAIGAFRPDVVHVLGAGIRFLRIFDSCLENIPWTFTAHNVPPAERTFSRLFSRPRLYYAARNALAVPSVMMWFRFLTRGSFRNVVCHSESAADRLRSCGCSARKISLIPFGCDVVAPPDGTPSPFPPGASPKILTIAGFAPHKGQLDAVHAVARLMPAFPNLAFRLIGNPRPNERYARMLEREIAKLGLQDRVVLLQNASEAVKHAALRDADLYLQPSHEEGFCIAFLEAATIAPRLVGTATGAMSSIAGTDTAMQIVPVRDVAAMVRAKSDLLGVTLSPGTISERRARLLATFAWPTYIQQHLDLFQELSPTLGDGRGQAAAA